MRGLHYQLHQLRQVQGKLISVAVGELYDVVVDIRPSSPTFGRWLGINLSARNHLQLWVPPGFAHGFYVISEWAEVTYKPTDYCAPEWERSLLWSDPALAIEWILIEGQMPLLSVKDAKAKILAEADLFESEIL